MDNSSHKKVTISDIVKYIQMNLKDAIKNKNQEKIKDLTTCLYVLEDFAEEKLKTVSDKKHIIVLADALELLVLSASDYLNGVEWKSQWLTDEEIQNL